MRKSREGVLVERLTNVKAVIENDSSVFFILLYIFIKEKKIRLFVAEVMRNILNLYNLIEIISSHFSNVFTGTVCGELHRFYLPKIHRTGMLAGFFF